MHSNPAVRKSSASPSPRIITQKSIMDSFHDDSFDSHGYDMDDGMCVSVRVSLCQQGGGAGPANAVAGTARARYDACVYAHQGAHICAA